MSNNTAWGQHLMLDIKGCNSNICNKNAIADFAKDLVVAIKMKAYGKPIIVHFAKPIYHASGYSLVQLIETSTITGHFSDNNHDAYLDIFSCKSFAKKTVIKIVEQHFAPHKIRTASILRGVHLPLQSPFQEQK